VAKRKDIDNKPCLFCNEKESVHNLLFECLVARKIWSDLSMVMQLDTRSDFESVAKLWLCNTNNKSLTCLVHLLCGNLCKFMNLLYFENRIWRSM
jgi:hypothetical protein